MYSEYLSDCKLRIIPNVTHWQRTILFFSKIQVEKCSYNTIFAVELIIFHWYTIKLPDFPFSKIRKREPSFFGFSKNRERHRLIIKHLQIAKSLYFSKIKVPILLFSYFRKTGEKSCSCNRLIINTSKSDVRFDFFRKTKPQYFSFFSGS